MMESERSEGVSKAAEDAVRRLLRKRLGALGLRQTDIRPGRDHDGDPVLFVDLQYDASAWPLDPGAIFGLVQEVRNVLAAAGETRFPHVRHRFGEHRERAGAA